MQIDRAVFFDGVRKAVFNGLAQGQVDGCNAIIAEGETRALDLNFLAYMLATAWWETAKTMQPIREIGKGRGRPYGRPDPHTHQIYYGRGLVQLTWLKNYQTMAKICLADLVNNPDLALRLDVAVQIMFAGMTGGLFTGKKLADYFHGNVADWVNARRIINGVDKASTVAAAAQKFHVALVAASKPSTSAPTPTSPKG